MRSSSLCHQRLKVGRGWCKAELQDLLSAGRLCSLSWAVGVPLRLEPCGEGVAWCWGPATHSSQKSPVSLPLRPQFFYHSSLLFTEGLTFTEFSLCKELLKMLYAVLKMQYACYLQLSHSARHDFEWKAGTQVPEVTRAFGVDMAQPRCSICLQNHLPQQQVPENGNELSPQDNRLSLKQTAAAAGRDEKVNFLNI